ncbi:Flp family type IVb pilin [Hydrocarboniphaga sp.]|uniref:Flp family type IVb pilin n=1 Tax=Hydrocarboniphaga sp. TaxID=2033016 RepID=UPI003D0BC86E
MFTKIYASLPRRQEGATAVEYGLIAGLIAVAIIVVLTAVGTDLGGLFERISGSLTTAGT